MESLNMYSYIVPENPLHHPLYALRSGNLQSDFFVGHAVQGVVCRFGCSAHTSHKEEMVFVKRLIDAVAMGFEECQTCKPLSYKTDSDNTKELLGKIESSRCPDKHLKEMEPNEAVCASAKKWFLEKHHTELQKYINVKRVNSLLEEEVVHSKTSEILTYQKYWTPLGPMIACFSEGKLCLLEFADRRMLETEIRYLKRKKKAVFKPLPTAAGEQLKKELNEYFEGVRTAFSIPLEISGTEFQLKAWGLLETIPYGETRSYKEQAEKIGNVKAIRAAGRANGMNRLAIIIPCHRVIGENGDLKGYGGGIERKKYLLNIEAKR